MRLVYGKYLPQELGVVAEARNRVSISTGLGVKCPVGIVVTVQLVSGADVIADIAAPLVRIDGGPGRSDEPRRARRIKKVSQRDEWQQPSDNGIDYGRALRIAENQ